ncbi:hypothetical protein M0R45_026979 [Rubus argutus]|uniref:No apical meristem-associated C-terminal domain-containing protein n=1 Tax=Rubus argutus TaxID=59490 RepID=A0AAW1X1M1_RUBAR
MLNQRWGKIQKYVNKFSGCFASRTARNESGKTEQDKIADAKRMFEVQEKTRFTLDHAWILLRHQPKWIQIVQELDSKTNNYIDIDEDMNTCGNNSRPPGRKAEKRKLKESTDQLV